MIVITLIDLAAFYMIFNKARTHPDEDSILFYVVATLQYGLSILATENLNLTTLLNPAALIVCAWSVILAMRLNRTRARTISAND